MKETASEKLAHEELERLKENGEELDKLKEEYISKCCKAKAEVAGMPDFEGDKYSVTMYYVCTKCKKPCDVINKTKKPNNKIK